MARHEEVKEKDEGSGGKRRKEEGRRGTRREGTRGKGRESVLSALRLVSAGASAC